MSPSRPGEIQREVNTSYTRQFFASKFYPERRYFCCKNIHAEDILHSVPRELTKFSKPGFVASRAKPKHLQNPQRADTQAEKRETAMREKLFVKLFGKAFVREADKTVRTQDESDEDTIGENHVGKNFIYFFICHCGTFRLVEKETKLDKMMGTLGQIDVFGGDKYRTC